MLMQLCCQINFRALTPWTACFKCSISSVCIASNHYTGEWQIACKCCFLQIFTQTVKTVWINWPRGILQDSYISRQTGHNTTVVRMRYSDPVNIDRRLLTECLKYVHIMSRTLYLTTTQTVRIYRRPSRLHSENKSSTIVLGTNIILTVIQCHMQSFRDASCRIEFQNKYSSKASCTAVYDDSVSININFGIKLLRKNTSRQQDNARWTPKT